MEGAAINFVRDAFGHLEAIAVDQGERTLLKTANVGQDRPYCSGQDAPMGSGKVHSNVGLKQMQLISRNFKSKRKDDHYA